VRSPAEHFAKTAFELDWAQQHIRCPNAVALPFEPDWQGDHARYAGQRKNLFDLRRCAVVQNLRVLAHADRLANAA
jgi:hypothetical protein